MTRLTLAMLTLTAILPADNKTHEELNAFLQQAVDTGKIPGVVVLVTSPKGALYHEAFGLMDSAHRVPMRKDAIFRIASMTKALTSTAVMLLIEERRLQLDDPIAKYLPAFRNPQVLRRADLDAGTFETSPATKPITVRQLLTHTSGIGYSWSHPALALVEKKTDKTSETDLPLLHEPGEKWTYGASTKVLGDLITQITGQPFDQFLTRRLLQPLGMHDTAYAVPAAQRARVVTLHNKANGVITETPNPGVIEAQPRGDGRLFSTAADYGQFLRLILNQGRTPNTRLLKRATVQQMTRNQTGNVKVRQQPTANPAFSQPYPLGADEDVWGLGFQIATPAHPAPDQRRPGSLTWAGINNTFYWIDPQAKIGAVVLMQMLPFYDEAALDVLKGVESRIYRNNLR